MRENERLRGENDHLRAELRAHRGKLMVPREEDEEEDGKEDGEERKTPTPNNEEGN